MIFDENLPLFNFVSLKVRFENSLLNNVESVEEKKIRVCELKGCVSRFGAFKWFEAT